jgi:hypothetical protein
MRHQLKFGEAATRNDLFSSGPFAPSPNSAASGFPVTNHYPALSRGEGSQITDHGAFLIDTLPIRIAFNSFAAIIGARSNRHSSDALKSFRKGAIAPSQCTRIES